MTMTYAEVKEEELLADHVLDFNDVSLNTIVEALEHIFNIHIDLAAEHANDKLTARFTDQDSVEEVLETIATVFDMKVTKSDNVYVMQCDFGWADLGTWHSIYECMQRTENDNVVIDSEVILDECQNNIIKLPKGHIGVFNGLDGYIVAEEGDVLLICKKSDSSALIRKYVNEVGIRYGEQYT